MGRAKPSLLLRRLSVHMHVMHRGALLTNFWFVLCVLWSKCYPCYSSWAPVHLCSRFLWGLPFLLFPYNNLLMPTFAEHDGLLPQDTELAFNTNVPDVFGATTEDTNDLRIVSLYEVGIQLRGQPGYRAFEGFVVVGQCSSGTVKQLLDNSCFGRCSAYLTC